MSTSQHYDAVIIGSGQGGEPLAVVLAQAGMRTLFIERERIGGTCVNTGCTPTKTIIASGRVAYLVRRAADYGVHTAGISVDLQKVWERKRAIVNYARGARQARAEKTANLDLVFGEAKFAGPKSVEMRLSDGARQTVSADHIIINTGTRAARPNIEGLESVAFLDNASILELDALPGHLVVLGGGYVGLEFGQVFRRFGCRVTIIHNHERVLPKEDPDVSEEIEKILREDGVEFFLNANVGRVSHADGSIRVDIQQQGQAKAVFGSHLLVAAGRVPNSDGLNLSAAGIETDARGYIKVNDRLETTASGVYALGDVTGGPAFTHAAHDDFRILRANLVEKKTRTTANRLIPHVIFIDPQLGRIGLTETEARRRYRNVRVAKVPMNTIDRALEVDETRGFMKAVVDGDTGQILGAAVLSLEGGEIMAIIQVAMMGRLHYTALRDGIFTHPTLAEALNKLFMAMDGLMQWTPAPEMAEHAVQL